MSFQSKDWFLNGHLSRDENFVQEQNRSKVKNNT
jgi:hypothetical protein